jgi:hypothetical protein
MSELLVECCNPECESKMRVERTNRQELRGKTCEKCGCTTDFREWQCRDWPDSSQVDSR